MGNCQVVYWISFKLWRLYLYRIIPILQVPDNDKHLMVLLDKKKLYIYIYRLTDKLIKDDA